MSRQAPAPVRARRIGARSAGALVVANMIGAGVFTPSGYALADLGRGPVLLAWALGGGVALACAALSGLVALGLLTSVSAMVMAGPRGLHARPLRRGHGAGLLRVRAREGAASVPSVGHPWLPLLFVAATLGSTAFLVAREPVQAAWGLATLALGLPLYALLRRRSSRHPSC